MVLTERDRALVALVAQREALTRVQIARALSFGSVSRVNSVLLRLVRHGYLSRRFQPTLSGTRRGVYLLGPTGHQLLGGTKSIPRFRVSSDLFLEHQLAINDAWLAFVHLEAEGYSLTRWLSERTLRSLALGLVPDACVEYTLGGQTFISFIESDLGSETLKRWEIKSDAYMHLAFDGGFSRVFNRRFFRVLVITTSERRVETLRHAIAKRTDKIFWLATRRALNTSGPFAPIWLRPNDATFRPLNER